MKTIKKQIEKKSGKSVALYLAGILILTIIVFSPTLKNQFVLGWDDELQVTNNKDIRSLSSENLKTIFNSKYVGMYQPLSTLTYALEYKFFDNNPQKRNPLPYHIHNLLLHLVNVMLVFFLIKLLTKKDKYALMVALLFAVHPMATESIAWISTRSNLLYSLFYLAGLVFYLKYTENTRKIQNLFYALLIFTLSLFSKATAVTFPLILVLFDIIKSRKFHLKLIAEKLPFFALSVIFGLYAFQAREEGNFLSNLSSVYSIFDRFLLITYSLMIYAIKFVLPVKLSAIYYYPHIVNQNVTWSLGWEYYLSGILITAIAILFVVFLVKKFRRKEMNHPIIIGVLFFLLTIFILLHFVPIGFQIITERYTYLPYIGFFLISAWFIQDFLLSEKSKLNSYKVLILSLFSGFVIFFSVQSFIRSGVWKTTETLMSDVIKKSPESSFHPFLIRGDGKALNGDFSGALEDFNSSVEAFPGFARSYVNRGVIFARLGDYNKSVLDQMKAVELNPNLEEARYNLGLSRLNLRDFVGAEMDFDIAIKMNPNKYKSWFHRANARGSMAKLDLALEDFNKAASLEPADPNIYMGRGVAYYKLGKYQQAIADFNNTLKLNSSFLDALNYRGLSFIMLGDLNNACNDFKTSEQLGHPKAKEYVEKYCVAYVPATKN